MKTALLFGSSGLIGSHILFKLIKNNSYHKIKLFVRSDPKMNDKKLEIINMLNQLDNIQFTQFSKFYNNNKNINLIDKYIISSKYVVSACTNFTKIIII